MRKEKGLCPEFSEPGRVKSRGLAICGEVEITLEAAQKYNGLLILPLIKRNEFVLNRYEQSSSEKVQPRPRLTISLRHCLIVPLCPQFTASQSQDLCWNLRSSTYYVTLGKLLNLSELLFIKCIKQTIKIPYFQRLLWELNKNMINT